MAETPSVSVVIPTYNRSQYLREALESVLTQMPPPMETIVADHGSDGRASQVAADFPFVTKIDVERTPESGPAEARNAALRVASGEWIAFLDDDDIWLPGKLTRQLGVAGRGSAALVCSNARVIDHDGRGVRERYLDSQIKRSGFPSLVRANWVVCSTVVARRDALMELGGFNESPELRAVEDYELWLRLAARWPVSFVDEPLIAYRIHDQSISRGNDDKSLRRNALRSALKDKGVRRKALTVRSQLLYEWGRSLLR